jgi:hypothetical protein
MPGDAGACRGMPGDAGAGPGLLRDAGACRGMPVDACVCAGTIMHVHELRFEARNGAACPGMSRDALEFSCNPVRARKVNIFFQELKQVRDTFRLFQQNDSLPGMGTSDNWLVAAKRS